MKTAPLEIRFQGGPGFEWYPDSKEIFYDYSERGEKAIELREVDPATGAQRVLVREQSTDYVDPGETFFRFAHDSGEIVWTSERDGWNHLYLSSAKTGQLINQITQGPWVVRQILFVDEKARRVYFAGCGREKDEDPYLVHVYSVGFDGKGLTLLTPENANHVGSVSPDGASLLVSDEPGTAFDGPLWALPVLGGSARQLAGAVGHAASWSPDGKKLAYHMQGLNEGWDYEVQANGTVKRGPTGYYEEFQWDNLVFNKKAITLPPQSQQFRQQVTTDALALVCRQHISMPYQIDIQNLLNTHDADESGIQLRTPELNACVNLGSELIGVHIGFVPAVGGDNALIFFCSQVDDPQQRVMLVISAASYRRHVLLRPAHRPRSALQDKRR